MEGRRSDRRITIERGRGTLRGIRAVQGKQDSPALPFYRISSFTACTGWVAPDPSVVRPNVLNESARSVRTGTESPRLYARAANPSNAAGLEHLEEKK